MRDGQALAGAIAVADAEARARDGVADAERAGGAAHERRLAGAELTAHEHDVTVFQALGQLCAEGFCLGGVGGVDDARSHDETVEPSAPTPLKRPARGRKGRGPIVTPGGMETGPVSARNETDFRP